MENKDAKKYLISLMAGVVLLLIMAVTINVMVDPFGMYRLINQEGFNANKPAVYNRVRLLKAYEVRFLKPESIVMGTSRVHLAFGPSHAGWAQKYARRYNLAFDGATTKEMYNFIVHTHASGELKHIMLGLDTYHLTNAPGNVRPDFDAALLMDEKRLLNGPRMIIADFKLLTSATTLEESFHTLQAQDYAETAWLAPDGQRLGEIFFHRPSEDFQKYGQRYYFDQVDKQEVGYKLEWRIPANSVHPQTLPHKAKDDSVTSLGYIKKIVDYCRANNIDLVIFLTPSHAHQLEISAATGEWPAIENGKRELVKLLNESEKVGKDGQSIPLYDFSGYSEITTESIPALGTRQEMKYYWDSSHFKENVGNLVLDRILGMHSHRHETPGNFGVRLTTNNISRVLGKIRKDQILYQKNHPDDLRVIRSMVSAFKDAHGIKD